MLHILSIILPVFGLIGLGYAARRSGYLGDRAGEGLSDFVFAVAVPALIIRTLTGADLPDAQPWGYWLAYFGGVVVAWTLGTLAAARLYGEQAVPSVVAGLTSSQSNTVNLGIPLILEAYGPPGAVPLFLLLAIHLPLMLTVATLLAERGRAPWRRMARQLALNPLLVAIFVAVAFRLGSVPVPGPAKAVIDMLGAAASPCALFAMGIALCRYGVGYKPGLAAIMTGLKLGLHPLIVYVLAVHVFTMPPVWAGVAVLFAAAPSGVNSYLFAERYGAGVPIASAAIALSTSLSVVTSAAWLAVLGVG